MKTLKDLVEDILPQIKELFPWDLEEHIAENKDILLVDITEPREFDILHIEGAINVPRGILEASADWNYEDTLPELAAGRDREVVLICRSGNRSALAAFTLQIMGFKSVTSLKTGLRGWNDFELPLVDGNNNPVDIDDADDYFSRGPRPDQMEP